MTFNNPDTQQSKQQLSLLKKSVVMIQPTVLLISALLATNTIASSIKFHDIAADPTSGLSYERTPSPELTKILNIFNAKGVLSLADDPSFSALTDSVNRSEGSPGIAILDYDGDGDQDIYVTNGPGTPNSLFKNQFKETGELTFVDVGMHSGAGAIEQDSSGVCCYGDIDNDGDLDLYVLGRSEPNLGYRP